MGLKNILEPLKFTPILKEKIWGGNALFSEFQKGTDPSLLIGESWELSAVPGDISQVSLGRFKGKDLQELINEFGAEILGDKVFRRYGKTFPLLFKFIDARDDLSIQVHPKEGSRNSKTEMWYILRSEPGTQLYSGFSKQTDQAEVKSAINEGTLEELLNKDQAEENDVFFLPSGRIHSIGKGLVLAEIQQSSDTTYRLYDFKRKDADGNERELHIEEGLEVLDFQHIGSNKKASPAGAKGNELVSCPYFFTESWKVPASETLDLTNSKDSFEVLMFTGGEGYIEFSEGNLEYEKGDTLLIPAALDGFRIDSRKETAFIKTWIP